MTMRWQPMLEALLAVAIALCAIVFLLFLSGCAGTGDKYKNTGLFCERALYMGASIDTKIFNLDAGVVPKADSWTVSIPPEGCAATITTTKPATKP